jgi:hypothetical protein
MATPRRATLAAVIVGIVVPLAITALAVVLQLIWLPELPDPAATHWGGTGGPNAFGSAWVFPVLTALVGLLLPAMALATLGAVRRGAAGFVTRLLAAASLGFAAMMAVTMTGSVAVQRGLADAADAGSVTGIVLASLAALVVVTAVGWFVQPSTGPAVAGPKAEATPLDVSPGERVAWVGTASTTPWLWVAVLIPLVTALFVATIAGGADQPSWLPWLLGGIGLLVVLALVMFTSFAVWVDGRGLTVRSTAGWPRLGATLDDIEEIAVIEVDPLPQFGGWGLRQIPGAMGVITRRGPALEVTRSGGRRLVVTIDDPQTAADLLAGLVERQRR